MTLLGKILAVLNVVAAVAFATLLIMDYGKREAWSYANFLYDVRLWGLPLAGDNIDPSVPRERVLSRHLDDATLKQVFAGAGEPVKTVDEEVQKLQGRLPGDLDNAATEAAGKFGGNDAEKIKGLQNVLMPLARTGPQIEALYAKITTTRGPALDVLVQEAVRRHLLNDLLDPLQQLWPADAKDDLTRHIVELDPKGNFAVTREKLDEFLAERLRQIADPNFVGVGGDTAKWDREARRQLLGDLIFTVTHLTKPEPDGKLSTALANETGPARAQAVLGVVQYNAATDRYADALVQITWRTVKAIEDDRDGVKGTLPGFVGKYREQVAEMRRLTQDILDRQARLSDLKGEVQKVQTDLGERKSHYDAIVKKIAESRAETLRLAQALRHLQQQLFVAQRESSTAIEDNRRLLDEIRQLEGLKKGGQ